MTPERSDRSWVRGCRTCGGRAEAPRRTNNGLAAPTRGTGGCGSDELEEDEDHEADEGERLGERDAEEHGRLDLAGRLGLAGHGLHGLADEVADADAGADGGEAVGDTGAAGAGDALGVVGGELRRSAGPDRAGRCG